MNKYIESKKERGLSSSKPDNKIVHLRKNVSPADIRNANDAINLAKQIREDLADDITEISMEQFMGWLTYYGIFAESDKFNPKDILMIENAIAGALYRYYGLDHPMHEVTDDVIKFINECDDNGEE